MELSEDFKITSHEGCDSTIGILVETKPREPFEDNGYRAFFGLACKKCGWLEYDVA
jgi:hypothetical protein